MQIGAAIFAAASQASCAGEAEVTGCHVEKEVLSQLWSAVDWLNLYELVLKKPEQVAVLQWPQEKNSSTCKGLLVLFGFCISLY